MLAALDRLAAGTPLCQPQPPDGSYQPLPQPADFSLDISWPIRRVFNFMRGTAEHGRPYPLSIAQQTIHLTEVLAYEPGGVLENVVVKGNGRNARILFSPRIFQTRWQSSLPISPGSLNEQILCTQATAILTQSLTYMPPQFDRSNYGLRYDRCHPPATPDRQSASWYFPH